MANVRGRVDCQVVKENQVVCPGRASFKRPETVEWVGATNVDIDDPFSMWRRTSPTEFSIDWSCWPAGLRSAVFKYSLTVVLPGPAPVTIVIDPEVELEPDG